MIGELIDQDHLFGEHTYRQARIIALMGRQEEAVILLF